MRLLLSGCYKPYRVDLLLRAFVLVRDRIPDYQLVFAGPDEGMQSDLTEIARQADLAERVHFLGFISGQDKAAAYQMARLLVVPSRQEAMSIVALEGGICGTAVMLTDQCGFGEITSIDPALEVPASVAGLAEGLVHLLNEPGLLDRIAPAIRNFVSNGYTWQSIVVRYLDLYKGILKTPAGK